MGILDDIIHTLHLGGGGAVNGPHGGTAPATGWATAASPLAGAGWASAPTAAGGGWAANLTSTGGWATGGGSQQQNPEQVAQKAVGKDLGFLQSAPGWAQQQGQDVAAGKTNSKGGFLGNVLHDIGSPLSKVISVLDLPRDAVVSGIDQLSGHGDGFVNDLKDHVTFGHVLKDFGVHNNWATRIGGLVGDVGLDPLTYVGGLGEVVKGVDVVTHGLQLASKATEAEKALETAKASQAGARSVGRLIDMGDGTFKPANELTTEQLGTRAKALRSMANKATGNGLITAETFNRLNRGGVGALSDEEKQVLGLRSGVGFGTHKGSRVPLLAGPTVDKLSAYMHELGAAQRDKFAAGAFAKKVMPHFQLRNAITEAVHNGEFEQAHHLTQALKATPLAFGARQAFLNTHGPKLSDALKPFTPDEMPHLRDALEGVQGAKLAGDERVTAVRSVLNGMRDAANKQGVNIANLGDYFPHQITDAAKKVQGVKRPSKAFTAELARTLRPGDKFLGETLQDGSVSEINRIMGEQGLNDLFNTDPTTVLSTYLHGLSSRVGQQAYANHLQQVGITHNGMFGLPQSVWESLVGTDAFSNKGNKAFGLGMLHNGVELGKEVPRGGDTPTEQGLTRRGIGSPTAGSVKLAGSGAFGDVYGPQHIKDALEMLAKERQGDLDHLPSKYGQYFDKLLGMWRKLELAAPGKAIRHAITGPAWGHYIGGVDVAHMPQHINTARTFLKAAGAKKTDLLTKGGLDFEKGLAAVRNPQERQWMSDFIHSGLTHGRTFGHDANAISAEDYTNEGTVKMAVGTSRKAIDKVNLPSKYLEGNRELQARVQDFSRWAMYADARRKGLSNLTAAQKVRSILGDPNIGTEWERHTARRIVPFYMFMRQQMPAQTKALARTPNKFVDFVNAERNLQEGEKRPPIVPQFYDQTMSMMLPFKEGGNQMFMSPDLPFTRINQQTSSLNQLGSNLNPLIQLAIEKATHSNLSTGAPMSPTAQQLPGVDQPIAPILKALGIASQTTAPQTDYGTTTPAGTYRITPFMQAALDSLLPPEGQARRVDTANEPNMAQRSVTTDLSYLLGQNFRSDDPYQQASELYRRDQIIKQLIESLQNKGELPAYLRGFKK